MEIPGDKTSPGVYPLFCGIGLLAIGTAKQIINTDAVKISQPVKTGYGDIQITKFIIGIRGLVYLQQLSKLLLFQIPIFPQIP